MHRIELIGYRKSFANFLAVLITIHLRVHPVDARQMYMLLYMFIADEEGGGGCRQREGERGGKGARRIRKKGGEGGVGISRLCCKRSCNRPSSAINKFIKWDVTFSVALLRGVDLVSKLGNPKGKQ